MSTEKRRHDWNNLEGEALELALAEAMGLRLNGMGGASEDGRGWWATDSIATFEFLTTVVWERYLKPRNLSGWKLEHLSMDPMSHPEHWVAKVGYGEWVHSDRRAEEALARAMGEALEAGE